MRKKHFRHRCDGVLRTAPVAVGLLLAGAATPAMAGGTAVQAQVVQAKAAVVKGTVTDSAGEPLTGVSVIGQDGKAAAITDINGAFQIDAAVSKLTFTYVGYLSKTVDVAGKSTLNVVLEDDAKGLEEVVVIGYGTVRKADLAGSVSVLDSKSFRDQPVTEVSDALQGRVAGVMVQSSGIPGGDVKIRVRGANSINTGNDPLYVVDGIVRESGLSGINPEDIQSMQVLKDASSTAIYGSRGANGVVLITTKTGKAGQKQIVFDAAIGTSAANKRMDVLGTVDYAKALMDIKATPQAELADYLSGKNPGVDWQDEIFKTGTVQNYKLAISGGSTDTQYYVSGNYMKNDGIVLNTSNERFSVKANVASQVAKWLNLTADVNASHITRNGGGLFTFGNENPIYLSMLYSPTMAIQDANGNYNKDPYNSIDANPVGLLTANNTDRMMNIFNGRIDLRFNIAKGLTFTTTNGVDYFDRKTYSFSSKKVTFGTDNMGNSDNHRMMLQSTNNLTYAGSWGAHNLTATAVYEATMSESRDMSLSGTDLQTEGVGYWNYQNAATRDGSNGYSRWALQSWVGRAVYSYDNRYMLTGTIRADGSSRFLKKKWGYFPSVAAAWTISNEKFMEDASAISNLKLRASYGLIGNQGIGVYSTLGLMSTTSFTFGDGQWLTGYTVGTPSTPELTWEKTRQFDLGVDLSMFNGRIDITLDYFNKLTYDALIRKSLPGYKGGGSTWVNDGEIANSGIDLGITGRIFQGRDFNWTTTVSGTYLKNEVKKLSGGENNFYDGSAPVPGGVTAATRIAPGLPIGAFWGYEWAGLNDKGNDTYYDKDGKTTTQPDGDDRRFIGKATPDFTLGWNNSLSYKNWDLNLFFTGGFGMQRLNILHYTISNMAGKAKMITLADAYNNNFDKGGDFYASYSAGGNSAQAVSTKWLENADYFRLENISLAYTFPKSETKFADVRLALSAQNLFTLTGYKGFDPAGMTFGGGHDSDAGIDMGTYPLPRTFTFSARFTF